jgi:hypothetical protein
MINPGVAKALDIGKIIKSVVEVSNSKRKRYKNPRFRGGKPHVIQVKNKNKGKAPHEDISALDGAGHNSKKAVPAESVPGKNATNASRRREHYPKQRPQK